MRVFLKEVKGLPCKEVVGEKNKSIAKATQIFFTAKRTSVLEEP